MALSSSLFVLTLCVYLNISYSELGEADNSENNLDTWFERRESHRFKTLLSERMKRVAAMSDMENFKDLLKPILRVRDPGSSGNKRVQEHIRSKMRSFGWTVEDDAFSENTVLGDKDFNNIIAVQDPSLPRRLTFACHFDSKYFPEITFIGATDSAVPCAMMLDMAHSLNHTLWGQNRKKDSDVSLQFLFLDGEEAFVRWTDTDSIYGARHLAAKMVDNLVTVDREYSVPEIHTIDVFILLDLIGVSNPTFRNWFASTEKHFQRLQRLELQAARLDLLEPKETSWKSNKYFIGELLSQSRGGISDDHLPFQKAGVPILHLIDYPFPHQWHTAEDNAQILDYTTIDNLNKILRIFVCEYLHLLP